MRFAACCLSLSVAVAAAPASAVLAQSATSTRPAVTGIAFVRFSCSDMAASERFYRGLGYLPQHAGANEVFAVSGRQWIELAPDAVGGPAAGLQPGHEAHLLAVGFTTADAAGLERRLRDRGIRVVEPLAHGEFTVLDPEGNRIAFVQAGSYHPTPTQLAAAMRAPSQHIIHAGFEVRDAAAEDRFFKDDLGFTPYWHGGMTESKTQWSSLQVPDGRDWIEYMLDTGGPNETPQQTAHRLGGEDHVSLGVATMPGAIALLKADGCQGAECSASKLGRDGKVQLNLFDPDLTRVEYMEFKPSGPVCCSAFTGPHPDGNE